MEPILQIENLTHTYSAGTPFQRSAVEGLSLTVGKGEFLGIIGHTGSGKSTLIQHLNGLLQPTSGHILLEGKDIWAEPKKIRDVRFKVGLVFQYPEYQLFEETVYKDIAFGPKNMGLDSGEIDRRVRDAAAFVGLDAELLDKSPFELSGGQKRRVAIAGVIAMEPKVLVLDEPTAGLDPQGRDAILAQIQTYHRAKGAAVVLVSRVPFKSLTKGLKPVYFVVAFTAIMNMFFTAGTPVADVWLLRSITWEGIIAAVQMVLRIILLIMGTFLMTYTTSPIALTDAMENLLGPLKKLKLPVHELAMMMSIALRFIPTLIEETDKIMSAQKARGADFETGNIFQRAKALVPILVPLFISAFRRADELATAMECRCYHGGEGRTALRVLRYKAADYAVLAGFVVLTAGIIVLKKFGF